MNPTDRIRTALAFAERSIQRQRWHVLPDAFADVRTAVDEVLRESERLRDVLQAGVFLTSDALDLQSRAQRWLDSTAALGGPVELDASNLEARHDIEAVTYHDGREYLAVLWLDDNRLRIAVDMGASNDPRWQTIARGRWVDGVVVVDEVAPRHSVSPAADEPDQRLTLPATLRSALASALQAELLSGTAKPDDGGA